MNISIPSIKHKCTSLLLPALAGAVVATGIVVMLVSEKVGAFQLAQWQIAAIYVAAIAAGILIGMKGCAKECAKGTLYEKIGGEKAVDAAVDIFYRKVLEDKRINYFFEGVDMQKQAAKQKAFLTMAFGGPNNYTGEDMRKGHAHLVAKGLNDKHFDAVIENLGATLKELNVPAEFITQAAAIAESTRKDVLGK